MTETHTKTVDAIDRLLVGIYKLKSLGSIVQNLRIYKLK